MGAQAHQRMNPWANGVSHDYELGWAWSAHILPYLEQLPLHDQIDFTSTNLHHVRGIRFTGGAFGYLEGSPNLDQAERPVQVYLCPNRWFNGDQHGRNRWWTQYAFFRKQLISGISRLLQPETAMSPLVRHKLSEVIMWTTARGNWTRIAKLAATLMLLSLVGCSGSENVAVRGIVTLDGTPVANGRMRFNRVGGGPVCTVDITNGHYDTGAAKSGGLIPGKHLVEISILERLDDARSENSLIPPNVVANKTVMTFQKELDVGTDDPGQDFKLARREAREEAN